jgi:MFS family permease
MSAARALFGLLIIGVGTSPAALDTSLNIAFPSLTTAFAIELGQVQWVVISYTLTYASLMLVFGRLGDIFGHRRVFQVGLLTTAAGLVAAGLAPSFGWLLGGRALQGVGVALLLSCGPALATSLYPERVRARVLGAYGALFAIGTALGPLVGGMLLEEWGWSAVFLYRVPLVLLAFALSSLLPVSSRRGARGFDPVSAALLAVCISTMLLALASLQRDAAAAALIGLAAIAALTTLIGRERRAEEPIIPLAAVREVDIGMMHIAAVSVHAASFAVLLLVPFYLTDIAGLSGTRGGLLLSLSATGAIVGSLVAGRLAAPLGSRRIAFTGALVCAAGLAAIGRWTQLTLPLTQCAALLVQGVGVGMFQVGYADLVIAAIPIHHRGVAGSLVAVTRTMGVVAGAAGISAFFARAHLNALAREVPAPEAFLAAFQSSFSWTSVALAAMLALTLVNSHIWLAKRSR